MPSFLPAGLPLNTWLMLTSCILLASVLGLLVLVGYWLRELKVQEKRLTFLGDDVTRALLSAKNGLDSLRNVASTALPELQKKISGADNAVQDLKFLISRAEQVAEKLEKAVENARDFTVRERGGAGADSETVRAGGEKPGADSDIIRAAETASYDNAALRAAIVRAAAVMKGGDGGVPSADSHAGAPLLGVKTPAALVPVVQANGDAALSATEPSRPNPRDPLDELLAGLSEANRGGHVVASVSGKNGEDGGASSLEHDKVRRGPVSQAELDLRKKMGGLV